MDLADLDKAALLAAIDRELTRAVDAMAARAKASAAAATHDEARAEDKHDTRAIEQSYLARGQAARVAELELDRASIRALEAQSFVDRPIAASALVELEDDGGEARTIFLVPRGGGRNLTFEGREITLATPASPLGAAVLGAEEGDEVEVTIRGRRRTYGITAVA